MNEHSHFELFDRSIRDLLNFLSTYKHKRGLQSMAEALDTPLLQMDRIIDVRWLRRFNVLKRLAKNFPVVQAFLQNEEGFIFFFPSKNITFSIVAF